MAFDPVTRQRNLQGATMPLFEESAGSNSFKRSIACAYLTAKEYVIQRGFSQEIDWQGKITFESVGESDLLREAAWVILSCGLREQVVREKFDLISEAFLDWTSAQQIVNQTESCRAAALAIFNHPKKIDAIIEVALRIWTEGVDDFKQQISSQGVDYIMQLPFMGPVSSLHFAKNIGINVAKPDRHLKRIADCLGYISVEQFCADIAHSVGDQVCVIDLVLWRYANLNPDYLKLFQRRPVEQVRQGRATIQKQEAYQSN